MKGFIFLEKFFNYGRWEVYLFPKFPNPETSEWNLKKRGLKNKKQILLPDSKNESTAK